MVVFSVFSCKNGGFVITVISKNIQVCKSLEVVRDLVILQWS